MEVAHYWTNTRNYQLNPTLIPSGLLSKPRYSVCELSSHEDCTSVIFSPLLSVSAVCAGAAGNRIRMLFFVFKGLLAMNE